MKRLLKNFQKVLVLFFLISLIFNGTQLISQPPDPGDLTWYTFQGGLEADEAHGLDRDDAGNFYIVGRGTADWDMTGQTPVSPVYSHNPSDKPDRPFDVFAAKFSPDGVLIWYTFLGDYSSNDDGWDIAVDSDGEVFVVGQTNNWYFTNIWHEENRAFLAKLDNNGNFLWMNKMGTRASPSDKAVAVDIDESGAVYVTGSNSYKWTWPNPGGDPFEPLNDFIPAYGGNSFVAKFANNGNYVWHTFFGPGVAMASDIVVEGTNIYLSGTASFRMNIPGIAPAIDHAHGETDDFNYYDGFALKMNIDGVFLWYSFLGVDFSSPISSGQLTWAYALDADDADMVYITGESWRNFNYGAIVNTSPGLGPDCFVAKMNTNDYTTNCMEWSTFHGYNLNDRGEDIKVDVLGNIFVGANGLSSSNVLLMLDNNGNMQWLRGLWDYPGTGQLKSIVWDETGSLYFAGTSGTPWNPSLGGSVIHEHQTEWFDDAFLAKMYTGVVYNSPPVFTVDTDPLNVELCEMAINTGVVTDPDGDPVALNADPGGPTSIVNNGDGTWTWSIETSAETSETSLGLGDHQITIWADDGNGGVEFRFFDLSVEDNSPPLPDLSELPIVEGECEAIVEIVPTATDNCEEVIEGTTEDPLTYSEQGTYTITWSYDDGNQNITTQDQTVIVVFTDSDGDGVSVCNGDCDDTDDTIYPGAPELCNGIDDDCDGLIPPDEIDENGYLPCSINAGDLVITEIMNNPSAVNDSDGEWFEVYNSTEFPINMMGWTIKDNDDDSHFITSSLVVPAGGYLVLGNNSDLNTNGGVSVDYEYGSAWFLANGADEIIIEKEGQIIIDQVLYDGGPTFPDPNGASMSLDPTMLTATDNDIGSNWCESYYVYGFGDKGTPGSPNLPCFVNPGDLVITEIMNNPSAVYDSDGEWFEVYNSTEFPINMVGMTIRDNGSDTHVIADGLMVPAGGYLVLGNNSDLNTNGGVSVDYEYGSAWFLANGADEIIIEKEGQIIIDQVLYDGGPTFPDPNGASMSLDPTMLTATDNDIGSNWCESYYVYGFGDKGTPGSPNLPCLPIVDLGPDLEVCEGETVTLDAGNPGCEYLWSTGETTQTIQVSIDGLYWVEVANEAGMVYDEIYVTVYPEIPCDIIVSPQPPFQFMTGNILSAIDDPSIVGWTCSNPDWEFTSDPALATIEYTAGIGSAIFTVTYDNGCIWTCSTEPISSIESWEYCTLTQGFYGNDGGVYCGEQAADELMEDLLDPFLMIGGDYNNLYLAPEDANCLIGRLPAGGASIPIDGEATCGNPTGIELHKKRPRRFKNTLVGQTITLGLNLRLDDNLAGFVISTRFLTTAQSSGCGTGDTHPINESWQYNEIPSTVYNYLPSGSTVQDLYLLANEALNGDPVGGVSLEDITEALGAINDGFDECMFGTFNGNYWPPEGLRSNIANNNPVEVGDVDHAIFPNPVNTNTIIEFTLPEASNVTVEIYNISGARLNTLYNGFVEKNITNTVSLDVNKLTMGIYIYVIHTDYGSFYGKMIKK